MAGRSGPGADQAGVLAVKGGVELPLLAGGGPAVEDVDEDAVVVLDEVVEPARVQHPHAEQETEEREREKTSEQLRRRKASRPDR